MGEEVDENLAQLPPDNSEAIIKYELSKEQKRIAQEVLESYKDNKDTLLYAVCGAGKTELVFKVIEYALKNKFHVGFAIPRRDVVIELAQRFKRTFVNNKVISLYGGNNDDLYGDIIVLTTHQLYRYENYFDLLIMDEIDAFPYKDNPVLIEFFKRSVKGHYVLMSATPSLSILKEFKKENHITLNLFTRYHMHPIPVPKIVIMPKLIMFYYLYSRLKAYMHLKKPTLVFVPTIAECEEVYRVISQIHKEGNFVHSKVQKRSEIIENFRRGKYKFLITTAVLERGVTLKNLQVIIFHANHKIYNTSSLIQISGRVGRVKDAPTGDIIFLGENKTNDMEEAIRKTNEANKHLQRLL